MPLAPKWRFRLNRYRNRIEGVKDSVAESSKGIFVEHKMCPACRALVDRNARQCPFCEQTLRVVGTGPTARLASKVLPTGLPVSAFLILANFFLFALEIVGSGYSFMSIRGDVAWRLGESLPLGYIQLTHDYWRWCTAIFLHAGVFHIGMNMWALYIIGPLVEQLYGRAKFLTVYMLAGFLGFGLSSFTGHASLGASGAIFGLLGVMVTYGIRRRDYMAQQIRSEAMKWIIYSVVMTFLFPAVDNYAHFGGLVTGALFGYLVADDPPLTEGQIRAWQTIQWLVVLLTAGCFFLMARRGNAGLG